MGSPLVLRERLFRLNVKIQFDNAVFVPWLMKYDPADSPFILLIEATSSSRDGNSLCSEATITPEYQGTAYSEAKGSVNDSFIVVDKTPLRGNNTSHFFGFDSNLVSTAALPISTFSVLIDITPHISSVVTAVSTTTAGGNTNVTWSLLAGDLVSSTSTSSTSSLNRSNLYSNLNLPSEESVRQDRVLNPILHEPYQVRCNVGVAQNLPEVSEVARNRHLGAIPKARVSSTEVIRARNSFPDRDHDRVSSLIREVQHVLKPPRVHDWTSEMVGSTLVEDRIGQTPTKDENDPTAQRMMEKRRPRRIGVRCLFSTSSSESDSEIEEVGDRVQTRPRYRSRFGEVSRVVKALRDWDLKFSASENEDPQDFLGRLGDCKKCYGIEDDALLRAIPSVLGLMASRWYRVRREEIDSWKKFKKLFSREFVVVVDDEDVLDELKARTQAKGEKITEYLSCVKIIARHLRRPISADRLLKIVYRGLTPEYRRFLMGYQINSLHDLQRTLRSFERVKENTSCAVPPQGIPVRPDFPSMRTQLTARDNSGVFGGAQRPFLGSCYLCQVVGHRASECSFRTCFNCHEQGHNSAECRNRQCQSNDVSCQVCGTEGTVFSRCPNCVQVREILGNAQRERQANPPSQSQSQGN